jgi:hypothetical protein
LNVVSEYNVDRRGVVGVQEIVEVKEIGGRGGGKGRECEGLELSVG